MAITPVDALPYSEIVRRPLHHDDCVLAVVDIQEKLLPFIHEKERVLRNSQLLIRLAGILGLPVALSVQYPKGLGNTVPEIASLLDGVRPIEKLEFGCFGNADYCSAIGRLSGRNTLLVCGIEAHICVTQTVLGALHQGLNVHVAADAVGSRAELNWKIGIERMRDAGAVISSTEMMIYELLGKSGTPAFKEILKYLK
ncbi:MAG TPA: hydrolase [Candidatus Angelobacter sp.]|nr:hydrolase [Candidatus Angelobacter sp.]